MQADLVLGAERCFQCGLWVLRSGYTPDGEHFCCQQQQYSPTHAFGKHVFLPWGPKYTFQSGLILSVHLEVTRFLYSPKPWTRRSTLLWMALKDTLKSMVTHRKHVSMVKKFLNKLFQAVWCFGSRCRLLFLRVKHGESHSPLASAALALPARPVLSFINQFQMIEHCGCALLDTPQPSLRHCQCKSPILCLFSRIPY